MLTSTGVDDATIRLIDNYEVDENGDHIALEPWAEIVKVIDNYEEGATRALACWDSAIVVRVKPNESGKERKAEISARSFTIRASIDLTQSGEQILVFSFQLLVFRIYQDKYDTRLGNGLKVLKS